jgi:hypothetical protein
LVEGEPPGGQGEQLRVADLPGRADPLAFRGALAEALQRFLAQGYPAFLLTHSEGRQGHLAGVRRAQAAPLGMGAELGQYFPADWANNQMMSENR